MNRLVIIILAVNLSLAALLTFAYPHLLVSPGKLIAGHATFAQDCFACHAPLTGAASQRCISCHEPAEIGRRNTAGEVISKPRTSTPFHQQLVENDCIACHSDHAGVKRINSTGAFNHNLLEKSAVNSCQSCHQAPQNRLHQNKTALCSECHSQTHWRPATFDHFNNFELDRDHNAECTTCHQGNDYSRYSCFGCHEHSPRSIRHEHLEEGIRNYENCVECHRNANEHDIRTPQFRKGHEENKGHKEDDDD
ncbi:MAG: class III cytochrome C family protein [Gammaproteobacteria bacterium]|nr:class III cytochrome C family protein [Gammaproteobacteria bacterium]